MSKGSQSGNNNRANQMNPNNAAFHGSRSGTGNSKPSLDNRANQMNSNHLPSGPAPKSTQPTTKEAGEPKQ